jgi:DNA-binding transcriptional LysR family regulator
VPQAAVGRAIISLEAAIDELALVRTARSVAVSKHGRHLLVRARRILGDAADLERSAHTMRGETRIAIRTCRVEARFLKIVNCRFEVRFAGTPVPCGG